MLPAGASVWSKFHILATVFLECSEWNTCTSSRPKCVNKPRSWGLDKRSVVIVSALPILPGKQSVLFVASNASQHLPAVRLVQFYCVNVNTYILVPHGWSRDSLKYPIVAGVSWEGGVCLRQQCDRLPQYTL